MPSITTWNRLEPRPRGNDLRPSLEGRVYDPAWLLARQWQVAEFRGQDAAFPVRTSYTVQSHPLLRDPRSPGLTPLEPLAAAEPAGTPTAAERAEWGAELSRLLTEHGCSPASIAAIVAAHPLPAPEPGSTDAQGADYLALLAGRLPDGAAIRDVALAGQVPAGLGAIAAADVPAVQAAVAAWLTWLDRFAVVAAAASDTWQPARLEHDFSTPIAMPDGGSADLRAGEWAGGSLEWYDFDVAGPDGAAPDGSAPGAAVGTVTGTVLPHPLSYPGMPDHRWWAFEDAYVNLASVQMAPTDLGRMLVVEFASVYSNDWYLQPLELPVGALHVVTDLEVTNSMGETVALGPVTPYATGGGDPAAAPDWYLFRPSVTSDDSAGLSGLLLPAAVADVQVSAPVESVVLIRDEVADRAWAVETVVQGDDLRPLDRFPAAVQGFPPPPPTPPDDGSPLQYLLSTDVPDIYFPLVPDESGQPTFRLLDRLRVDADGTERLLEPAGRLLAAVAATGLRQEEVPLEGAVVSRRRYLARGYDGRVLLWTGRQKRLGGAVGSPVLLFDQAVAPGSGSVQGSG